MSKFASLSIIAKVAPSVKQIPCTRYSEVIWILVEGERGINSQAAVFNISDSDLFRAWASEVVQLRPREGVVASSGGELEMPSGGWHHFEVEFFKIEHRNWVIKCNQSSTVMSGSQASTEKTNLEWNYRNIYTRPASMITISC